MASKKLTDRYQLIIPYLMSANATELINFLKCTFGAEEQLVEKREAGEIMHAAYEIEGHTIMVAQANGDYASAQANIFMYVADSDQSYNRALDAATPSWLPWIANGARGCAELGIPRQCLVADFQAGIRIKTIVR